MLKKPLSWPLGNKHRLREIDTFVCMYDGKQKRIATKTTTTTSNTIWAQFNKTDVQECIDHK